MIEDVKVAAAEQAPLNVVSKVQRHVVLKWTPTLESWVKLNTDGSYSVDEDCAACGGVPRDHHGNFLLGFTMKVGVCSILHAELWGLVHGLRFVLGRGFSKILIEADSAGTIEFLNKGCPVVHPCFPLVREFHHLVGQNCYIHWKHVYREVNFVADSFAKNGLRIL
uniref:RNase H type-1 domain-containing protein n=1 Tax=Lotus japonicus TaxID=34305 RepID=I3SY99_LOTJA|nr:unknown [Lotus japonicus]